MAERQKHWPLGLTIVLVFGLLLEVSFVPPRAVLSAPLTQEQPSEHLYLDYGDDVTETLYAEDGSEVFQRFVFHVHVPAGAQLSVWLGEDPQGGCYSDGRLFMDGNQIGYTSVGPGASDWSEPIVATITSGYAQLSFGGTDDCESWVSFPVEKYIRFKVESPPGEVIEVPAPEIQFWTDRTNILRGECTVLHWRTENVQAVYYQDAGVSGDGERQECPQQTTTYELYVIIYQAAEQLIDEARQITIYVAEPPTSTFTPTPVPPTHTHTPRPPTRTPTPRPPTRTPTSRPPTRTPTPRPPTRTPTPRPGTPTPTRRPLFLVAPASPTPVSPPSQSVPPWVLVVTDAAALEAEVAAPSPLGAWNTIEGWLRERYGADNVDVLDLWEAHADRTLWEEVDQAIHERVQAYTGLPTYILIIGGPEVVAFGEVYNPLDDGDTIYTDDLYGDFDGDGLHLPEVPTARLPDGGDFELYREQFSQAGGRTGDGWGSAMVIANVERPYGRDFADLLDTTVQWSAPVSLDDHNQYPATSTGHSAYFILHGSGFDTGVWTGEDPAVSCWDRPVLGGGSTEVCDGRKFLPAWNVDWARGAGSQGTVISGACYGAFIGLPRTWNADRTRHTWPVPVRESIALTYLRNGTEAFMGHTASTVSYVTSYWSKVCWPWPFDDTCSWHETGPVWPVDEGSEAIEWFAFSEISNGQHPLTAFSGAKAMLANTLGPPDAYNRELKALHSFVYYGLPPAPVRIEF